MASPDILVFKRTNDSVTYENDLKSNTTWASSDFPFAESDQDLTQSLKNAEQRRNKQPGSDGENVPADMGPS